MPLKDRDLQDAVVWINAALAGIPGAVLGGALGYFLVAKNGFPEWWMPLLAVVGAAFVTSLTLIVVFRTSNAAQGLYNPSGASTPHQAEYSFAESLAVRGQYEEAIDAFEVAIAEGHHADPTPYLRIARIYRDQLERLEDAARWFKRALREPEIHRGLAHLVRRELVELYEVRMLMPKKAAPLLARMVDELAGTSEGEWAAAELARIKEIVRRESETGSAGHPSE